MLKRKDLQPYFYEAIVKNWLCLASPVLSNLGTERGMPISCFGINVGDSIEGNTGRGSILITVPADGSSTQVIFFISKTAPTTNASGNGSAILTRDSTDVTSFAITQNTTLQQVDPKVVEDSTPQELKPKGKQALGKRILTLGKKILQLILPKLVSMVRQYAIGQFEEAKAQATTPEQIEELKQQYCPAPSELAQLIQTRDNIVNQLNSIGTRLDGLNFSIGITQDITNALSQLSTIIESVKIGLSAAAKVLPITPGSVPAILNDLETLDDKVIPIIEKNQGALNSTAVPIAAVTSTINKVVRILNQLDILISFCAPNSQVVPISNTVRTLSEIQVKSDINSGNYKGFVIQIEEEQYTPTVTRRKAVASNTNGIKLLETPLSFTTNNQTLIDELKFIIDQNGLRAY